jgi:hypothetical protein
LSRRAGTDNDQIVFFHFLCLCVELLKIPAHSNRDLAMMPAAFRKTLGSDYRITSEFGPCRLVLIRPGSLKPKGPAFRAFR